MPEAINFTDIEQILKGYPEGVIDLYEAVDHEYYGTYYTYINGYMINKQVKCVNKKWYDCQGNYIRDWNEQDNAQALDQLPY